MNREYFLEEAKKCVCGGRDQDYGTPEDNFALIAKFWSVYKGIVFERKDVPIMMSLLKIARSKNSDSADNFIDLCGYACCAGEIVTEKQE